MSIERAREIRGPSSAEEARSIEKAKIQDFYGECTVETVTRDKGGTRRKKAQLYGDLKAFREGHRELFEGRDRRDLDRGGIPALRFHRVRLEEIDRILKVAGIERIEAGLPVHKTKALEAVEYVKGHAGELQELGIKLRSNAADDPMTLISSVLGKLGVKLKSKKRRATSQDGVQTTFVRDYWIDEEALAGIEEDSARYYDQLLNPPIRGAVLVFHGPQKAVFRGQPRPSLEAAVSASRRKQGPAAATGTGGGMSANARAA